jgi:heat-inducible transcriptional repressor
MGISERKEKILQAVVDSYIVSCEPISSSTIRQTYLPELSSATIRNELATLEEMGYLEQPHTSAGRVPTAQAYRLYVDKLMPKRKLSKSELNIVKQYFNEKITEIDDILKNTAKVISEITNLTSVAVIPNTKDARIEDIKIVKLTQKTALVIIVTDIGVIRDGMVELGEDFSEEYFFSASKFIGKAFKGYTFSDLLEPNKAIEEIKNEYRKLFDVIYTMIKNYATGGENVDIVYEGSAKLLDQPEYANVEKAKAMLEFLDTKEQLMPMIKHSAPDDMRLNIRIGKANDKDSSPECAIVTASYSVNGVNIGDAGVIGPIRMDYSKVVSVLDYIGKTISVLPEGKNKDNIDNKED